MPRQGDTVIKSARTRKCRDVASAACAVQISASVVRIPLWRPRPTYRLQGQDRSQFPRLRRKMAASAWQSRVSAARRPVHAACDRRQQHQGPLALPHPTPAPVGADLDFFRTLIGTGRTPRRPSGYRQRGGLVQARRRRHAKTGKPVARFGIESTRIATIAKASYRRRSSFSGSELERATCPIGTFGSTSAARAPPPPARLLPLRRNMYDKLIPKGSTECSRDPRSRAPSTRQGPRDHRRRRQWIKCFQAYQTRCERTGRLPHDSQRPRQIAAGHTIGEAGQPREDRPHLQYIECWSAQSRQPAPGLL